MPQDFVKAASTDELSPGQMKLVEMGEERILLVNLEGEYHAVDEVCTHAFAPLSEGDLSGEEVECPLHGSVFSARTGEVLTPPAGDALIVYQVRVEGGDVLIGPPR
jgi:3-phenylpropionate/trans-cinnamate dioxygenase ferredoxin subunit